MIVKGKSSKGQAKMMEIAIVLLVFVFFFTLVMIFYARFQFFEINKIANEVSEQRADLILSKIIGIPELRCSSSFGSASEINCLDTYKLLAFSSQREMFKDEFSGFNEIKIVREFGKELDDRVRKIECNINTFNPTDYPNNCGYWQILDKKGESRISFDTYVALCTPKDIALLECDIGRIIVSLPEK